MTQVELPSLEPASSASGSLLFPEGTVCRWCKQEEATTVLYQWPTGLRCIAGGPKERVRAYLADMKPREKRCSIT